jgi:predicted TIM-barrel fold metal-dependent hydrolase
MATLPVIDAWIQHPSERLVSSPMFDSIRRWVGAETIASIPPSFTSQAMEGAGVSKALLCAWCGPRGWLIDNDEVAEMIKARPDLYAGIASVDVLQPMSAVRELRRCVNDLGFKGLRILPWLWQLPPDDRRYYPLYAECIELDIPFCLQVGHAGPLMASEPGRPIPYLDHVAAEFPELKIVGGHIGYPWTTEMIAMATKYPNVYIDTSAYKPRRYPDELVSYMKRHGKGKVLFGSNFPMISPKACLDELDVLGLDDDVARLFLHDNAARVFGLDT